MEVLRALSRAHAVCGLVLRAEASPHTFLESFGWCQKAWLSGALSVKPVTAPMNSLKQGSRCFKGLERPDSWSQVWNWSSIVSALPHWPRGYQASLFLTRTSQLQLWSDERLGTVATQCCLWVVTVSQERWHYLLVMVELVCVALNRRSCSYESLNICFKSQLYEVIL